MTFTFGSPELLNISEAEIEHLLNEVYVDEGYTSPEAAESLFVPEAVRRRGTMICAREEESGTFTGMIIVVWPGSDATRIADPDETEMHLLAVAKEYRGYGLGRELVTRSFKVAMSKGFGKMVLWTQPRMKAARKLYESAGFTRSHNRDFTVGEKSFFVYEKQW